MGRIPAVACMLALMATEAIAQPYPVRPVRVICLHRLVVAQI